MFVSRHTLAFHPTVFFFLFVEKVISLWVCIIHLFSSFAVFSVSSLGRVGVLEQRRTFPLPFICFGGQFRDGRAVARGQWGSGGAVRSITLEHVRCLGRSREFPGSQRRRGRGEEVAGLGTPALGRRLEEQRRAGKHVGSAQGLAGRQRGRAGGSVRHGVAHWVHLTGGLSRGDGRGTVHVF